MSKSLETLAVRVDRHCESALEIAKKLEQQPKVNLVKYPFLSSHPQHQLALKQMKKGGNIISFEVKGDLEAGRKFINAIQLCSLSANLGDSRSIITHPSSTTHIKLSDAERKEVGISLGMIRLSVGLEHHQDIWNDIKTALDA